MITDKELVDQSMDNSLNPQDYTPVDASNEFGDEMQSYEMGDQEIMELKPYLNTLEK
jgi:hypothetical protein